VAAALQKWQSKNYAAWRREYQKKHPDKMAAKTRLRDARKLQAMPSWANKRFIRDMYMIARLVTEATGVKHQVDHIVPLRSPVVCGLHVEDNLQVITTAENIRKRNHFSLEAA
jgi:5-methylcytosine-specific restriction endonuclease McrA